MSDLKATSDDVRHAYRLLLGREADEQGYESYLKLLETSTPAAAELARSFFGSAEFIARCGCLVRVPTGPVPPHASARLQCQACTQYQLESPLFLYWAQRLGERPGGLHRKLWEWCFITQALYERDALQIESKGLGFAVCLRVWAPTSWLPISMWLWRRKRVGLTAISTPVARSSSTAEGCAPSMNSTGACVSRTRICARSRRHCVILIFYGRHARSNTLEVCSTDLISSWTRWNVYARVGLPCIRLNSIATPIRKRSRRVGRWCIASAICWHWPSACEHTATVSNRSTSIQAKPMRTNLLMNLRMAERRISSFASARMHPHQSASEAELQVLGVKSPIKALMPAFDAGHVAAVVDEATVIGLITRIDSLNYLRRTAA